MEARQELIQRYGVKKNGLSIEDSPFLYRLKYWSMASTLRKLP